MRAPRRWRYPSAYIGHALQGLIIGLALVGPIPRETIPEVRETT